jgi:hypothetical protein
VTIDINSLALYSIEDRLAVTTETTMLTPFFQNPELYGLVNYFN